MKRRTFLKSAAMAAAAGFTIGPRSVIGQGVTPPSEKLNIAGIGIGGQGAVDLKDMAVENIAALVDVDYKKAAPIVKT